MPSDKSGCLARNTDARDALLALNLTSSVKQRAIIFGFGTIPSPDNKSERFRVRFSKDDLYPFSSVTNSGTKEPLDLVLIKLQRPVPTDHIEPLRLQQSIPAKDETRNLILAGHPDGMLKIFDSDRVVAYGRRSDSPYDMRVSADNYRGNSGSPVIDLETGQVTGMIVCGKTDFEVQEESGEPCVAELQTAVISQTQEIAVSVPTAFKW